VVLKTVKRCRYSNETNAANAASENNV